MTKVIYLAFAGALCIAAQACAAQSDTLVSSRVELLDGETFLAQYAQRPDAYLIDCRTAGEQAGGMIDGAVPMDFRSAAFRQNVGQLERDRPVFVYCQAGGRSGRAAEILDSLGFVRVVDLEGGYRGLKKG